MISVKELKVVEDDDLDTVDMEQFWRKVELCQVARGHLQPGGSSIIFIYNT